MASKSASEGDLEKKNKENWVETEVSSHNIQKVRHRQAGRRTDRRAEHGCLRGINERICVHGRAFSLTTGCFVKKSSMQTCVCCWVNSHYPSHSICCFITSPGLKLNVFIMKPRCREKTQWSKEKGEENSEEVMGLELSPLNVFLTRGTTSVCA